MKLAGYPLVLHDKNTAGLSFINDKLFSQFYKKDALLEIQLLQSKTYVLLNSVEHHPVAYFTLTNDKLCRDLMTSNNAYKKFTYALPQVGRFAEFPAVKLKIQAVATDYQHLEIASELINSIKKSLIGPSNKSACRFLLVDSRDDAREFFTKHGFQTIDLKETHSANPMFFDLLKL